MTSRTVKRVHPGGRDDIGDLVTRRAIPGAHIDHLDPFLFLNHHGPQTYRPHNRGLPFGPHPHRGFETVSFIRQGSMAHRDSGGGEEVIDAGGVQWMTAGRGLTHAETSPSSFKERGGPLEILQLWVNLPAKHKMTAPKYVGLQQAQLPTHATPESKTQRLTTVTPVSGTWWGHKGPITPLTDVALATVDVDVGGAFSLDVGAFKAVFFYVVAGVVIVGGSKVDAYSLVEFDDDNGGSVDVESVGGPAVILLGTGTPFREPIVSHGPFVMNTEEEILQAIRDARAGRL